ncbi:MAG: RNA-binding cell elongation regulator Jag/EloR [Eubacteriales bacterium]
MNTITVTAKSIEEAITKATIQLGITSSELGYDVIEKGSAGFLGIGTKNSVIRAYRKADLPVEEKIIEKPVVKEEAKIIKKEVKVVEEKASVVKKQPKKPVKKEIKTTNENVEANKSVEESKPAKKEIVKEPKTVAKIEKETILATKKFIEDVLKSMDIEATVIAEVDEEGALSVNIDGKNMGVLIGKRGQTLDSLQYLANRVANKEQDGYIRVKLDTENYRERRKKTLENLAKNIAYKVKRTRKPVSLEPMNPYERRIIHSALQDDSRVSTHSEGDEPYRKVVVTLARK